MRIISLIFNRLTQSYLEWLSYLKFYHFIIIIFLIFIGCFLIYFITTDFIFSLFYYLYNFDRLDYVTLGIVLGLAVYLTTIILITNNLNKKNNIIKAERDELKLLNSRYVHEIEKRKKTERSLMIAEQSLEQSSKLAEIGQMSAAINHEISQPLSALKTYLSSMKMLIDRNRVLEAKSNFNRVDNLIERMEKITTQLRIFSGKSLNSTEKLNLLDSLDASLSLITSQFLDKRIRIKYKPPKKKIMVIGDELKIQQIIINLLNNAIDAVESIDDALISITLDQMENKTQIKISDNGHGIEQPEKVFEPFFTTKSPGKGVGLGLSISSELATKFGGGLTATNLSPVGSQFILTLRNG